MMFIHVLVGHFIQAFSVFYCPPPPPLPGIFNIIIVIAYCILFVEIDEMKQNVCI